MASLVHSVSWGVGAPLLLIHGLGGSHRSWDPILPYLIRERRVIALQLPGFGYAPPLAAKVSIANLADSVKGYLVDNGFVGIDVVGSSMGARLVLELARRGLVGGVVSLDPGGFWRGWERTFFFSSIALSIRLLRVLRGSLPFLARHAVTRALLLAQFSAHPARLPPQLVQEELCNYIASPSFDELLRNLAYGEPQQGLARGTLRAPMVIGWGRHDRVCLPRQAQRALNMFPGARLHWFDQSGHFPHWDEPQATARLILDTLKSSCLRHENRAVVCPKDAPITPRESILEGLHSHRPD